MMSWQQKKTLDTMTSQSHLWHHNGLEHSYWYGSMSEHVWMSNNPHIIPKQTKETIWLHSCLWHHHGMEHSDVRDMVQCPRKCMNYYNLHITVYMLCGYYKVNGANLS